MHISTTEPHLHTVHRNFAGALGVVKHTQIRGATWGTEIRECSYYVCTNSLDCLYLVSSPPNSYIWFVREIRRVAKHRSHFQLSHRCSLCR